MHECTDAGPQAASEPPCAARVGVPLRAAMTDQRWRHGWLRARLLHSPAAQVTLTHDGKTVTLDVPEDKSILEAAMDKGIELPHDCKLGVCMTCPAKLVRGRSQARAQGALEASQACAAPQQPRPLRMDAAADALRPSRGTRRQSTRLPPRTKQAPTSPPLPPLPPSRAPHRKQARWTSLAAC